MAVTGSSRSENIRGSASLATRTLTATNMEEEMVDVKHIVYDDYDYDSPFPKNLLEAVAWLKAHVDTIPVEFQKDAKLEVESESDSSSVRVCISYRRPETASEEDARIQREAVSRSRQEEMERNIYEKLKARFEPGQGTDE